MGIWERIRGVDAAGVVVAGKLSPHFFTGILAEVDRGQITQAAAGSAVTTVTGVALDATEQTESTAILNALGVQYTREELDDVLNLVELRSPPHDVKANTKTRLGF